MTDPTIEQLVDEVRRLIGVVPEVHVQGTDRAWSATASVLGNDGKVRPWRGQSPTGQESPAP